MLLPPPSTTSTLQASLTPHSQPHTHRSILLPTPTLTRYPAALTTHTHTPPSHTPGTHHTWTPGSLARTPTHPETPPTYHPRSDIHALNSPYTTPPPTPPPSTRNSSPPPHQHHRPNPYLTLTYMHRRTPRPVPLPTPLHPAYQISPQPSARPLQPSASTYLHTTKL